MERNGQPEDRAGAARARVLLPASATVRRASAAPAASARSAPTAWSAPPSDSSAPSASASGSGTGHAPDANPAADDSRRQPRRPTPGWSPRSCIGHQCGRLHRGARGGQPAAGRPAAVRPGRHRPATARLEGVAEGQWYRLFTSMFLHQEIWHIALQHARPVVPRRRRWSRRSAGSASSRLYLLSGLGGRRRHLSAGRAAAGVAGRLRRHLRPLRRHRRADAPAALRHAADHALLVINLVFTFTWKNIAWEAHIGGLVAGALLATRWCTPRGSAGRWCSTGPAPCCWRWWC